MQGEGDDKQQQILSKKQLLFQNIDYALDLYLIYVLTLSIFPGFLYENTGTHQLGSWWVVISWLVNQLLNYSYLRGILCNFCTSIGHEHASFIAFQRYLIMPCSVF